MPRFDYVMWVVVSGLIGLTAYIHIVPDEFRTSLGDVASFALGAMSIALILFYLERQKGAWPTIEAWEDDRGFHASCRELGVCGHGQTIEAAIDEMKTEAIETAQVVIEVNNPGDFRMSAARCLLNHGDKAYREINLGKSAASR